MPIYDWVAANFEEINNYLASIDWHVEFGFHFDADSIWTEFKSIVWPVIEMHVPKKYVSHKLKYRTRQYPTTIRILSSRKAAIWRKLWNSYSTELKNTYARIARECKTAILNFDIIRENKILDANNIGAFYKFVNKKLSSESGIAPLYDALGNLVISDEERANLLNEYFNSVFTKDDGSLPNFPKRIPDSATGICDVFITPTIISNLIQKLRTNSAAGPDGLPPIFFSKKLKII